MQGVKHCRRRNEKRRERERRMLSVKHCRRSNVKRRTRERRM